VYIHIRCVVKHYVPEDQNAWLLRSARRVPPGQLYTAIVLYGHRDQERHGFHTSS
jgi:hypothetical protein